MEKSFTVIVAYDATCIQTAIVEATDENEAIDKAINGEIEDTIDNEFEVHEIVDVEVIE